MLKTTAKLLKTVKMGKYVFESFERDGVRYLEGEVRGHNCKYYVLNNHLFRILDGPHYSSCKDLGTDKTEVLGAKVDEGAYDYLIGTKAKS